MINQTIQSNANLFVKVEGQKFLAYLLNKTIIVKRRQDWVDGLIARDILNAPDYGTPDNWNIVYPALKCRIEYSSNSIEFKQTGERLRPSIIMYLDDDVDVRAEDRIYDGKDIYIVDGKQIYYNTVGEVHHFEYNLLVP